MEKITNTGLSWGDHNVGAKQVKLLLNVVDWFNSFMSRLSHFLGSLARISLLKLKCQKLYKTSNAATLLVN